MVTFPQPSSNNLGVRHNPRNILWLYLPKGNACESRDAPVCSNLNAVAVYAVYVWAGASERRTPLAQLHVNSRCIHRIDPEVVRATFRHVITRGQGPRPPAPIKDKTPATCKRRCTNLSTSHIDLQYSVCAHRHVCIFFDSTCCTTCTT